MNFADRSIMLRAASRPWLVVALLIAAASPTRAQEPDGTGLMVSAAVGRSRYALDCVGPFVCVQPSGRSSKVGVGYQFGTFGVEAWYMNFGRSEAFDTFGLEPPSDRVQIQAAVLDAAWRWRWDRLEAALRAGLASVHHRRTRDTSTRRLSPHFGLGLGWALTPKVTLELGWDITNGEGSTGYGTTVKANSVALRVPL